MYSLDINLLSERPEYQSGKQSQLTGGTTVATNKFGKAPVFAGVGVAALTLLAVGGGWLWLGQQTTQLEAKQKDLDTKLGSLQAQDRRIQELSAETGQINDETQALASIFNQIQPWSAVLQDLRESIPQGVQIFNISQTTVPGTATLAIKAAAAPPPPTSGSKLIDKINNMPNPEAKPKGSPVATAPVAGAPVTGTPAPDATPTTLLPADIPTTKLDITGTAKSFEEVNNFMLTLKQSAFFNPDDTQLLSASLGSPGTLSKQALPAAAKTDGKATAASEKLNRLSLPKVVDYKIQTTLKRIPANELIRELERKGAVGLVTRLRSLQQQQVIK